jgi:hypothetical protein
MASQDPKQMPWDRMSNLPQIKTIGVLKGAYKMTEFITRFLSLEGGALLFGQNGSFCLNNLRVYREIESKNSKHDSHENICKFSNAETENLTPSFVSCWTLLESNNIKHSDWNIFPQRDSAIAIVSKVSNIEVLLNKIGSGVLNQSNITHGLVKYLDFECKQKPSDHDILNNAFIKRTSFFKEREYRFLVTLSSSHFLKSLIFYLNLPYGYPDYSFIESIKINPLLLANQKSLSDLDQLKISFIEGNVTSKVDGFAELYAPKCRIKKC